MIDEKLYQVAVQALKYGTNVYPQITNDYSVNNGEFIISYLYDTIQYDSLLFLVPSKFSLDTSSGDTKNYLILKRPSIVNGKRKLIDFAKMTIYVEQNDGTTKLASKGDIIANRLCIFRFIQGDSDSIILINSPYYNSMTLTKLTVVDKTLFRTMPVYQATETDVPIPLATKLEVENLSDRVLALENKFLYGTEDPEEALKDCPDGTIYVQVESLGE